MLSEDFFGEDGKYVKLEYDINEERVVLVTADNDEIRLDKEQTKQLAQFLVRCVWRKGKDAKK